MLLEMEIRVDNETAQEKETVGEITMPEEMEKVAAKTSKFSNKTNTSAA